MPKLGGPCMSQSASGALGKTLIFSSWKGKPRLKIYKKPTNTRGFDQQINRGFMAEAVTAWQELTIEEKAIWEGWK